MVRYAFSGEKLFNKTLGGKSSLLHLRDGFHFKRDGMRGKWGTHYGHISLILGDLEICCLSIGGLYGREALLVVF